MRFTRNRVLMLAVVTAVVAFLGMPSVAHAQSKAMKVSIPFEFHVGNQTLPPGSYTVQRIGDVIKVSDRRGHSATAITNMAPGRPSGTRTEVVFTQYGRQFFLSEARWQGYDNARRLSPSKSELELARTITAERVDLASVAH